MELPVDVPVTLDVATPTSHD